MMFGSWGDPDHDESIRDHPPRARRRHQLHRHRRRVLARRVRGDRRQGARRRGATTSCSRRSSSVHDGRTTRTTAGGSRRWIIRECRGIAAAPADRLHRPLPDAPAADPGTDIEETLGALDDLVRQGKVRYIGHSTFPAAQIVEAQWVAARARPGALRLRAAAVLDARPRRSRPTCCRRASATAWASSRGARWPAAGCRASWRKGADGPHVDARAGSCPSATTSRLPANQRKLDAADALARLADEAGLTLIAHGDRVRAPPPGGDVGDHRAAHDGAARVAARRRRREARRRLLDRIDEIVAPGTNLNPADAGWTNPALAPAARRR